MKYTILVVLIITGLSYSQAQTSLTLKSEVLKLVWKKSVKGWELNTLMVKKGGHWILMPHTSGEATLLYSEQKPDPNPEKVFYMNTGDVFPEPIYKNKKPQWEETTNAVSLNTAGRADYFFYNKGKQLNKNCLQFESETPQYKIVVRFATDSLHANDILVTQTLKVKKSGYYSLASPTLSFVDEAQMSWAAVPGYFQGKVINRDFVQAYAYGMGVPELPVIYRDRCASTLCPLVATKTGITYSVIPDPGLSRDPWAKDHNTLNDWSVGLSHKNRRSELCPTIYFPVLGEPKSLLKEEEVVSYGFRYSIIDGDWFKAINHAVYDIYRFKQSLALRQSKQSLTNRVEKMHHYVSDPLTSMWKVEAYKGLMIGAQSYQGGAMGANNDAMKNSDYGAMWFLAGATHDTILTKRVLPYALNFKIAQQTDTGYFKGAIEGQYYLAKKKKFVEEWGALVEPVGVTYYTMLDVGNILLFDPGNRQLQATLKNGADFLLKSQKSDGSWAVAYDHESQREIYKDVPDVRPTFYGLMVAYRILKDERYLAAARKGADWFLKNAVESGCFLGVCGDARYSPDFATGQSAQALLDLYDLTGDIKYQQAAVATARMYVCSIYTHPIAGTSLKYIEGKPRQDWEISQSGLSFEHGGILGSANRAGPILLCSHAGLFIRMYELTREPIFRDMARAGAIGRDAFVDPATSVASYYWSAMNKGAGPYPHHAWWQIGWITDYLLSEAHLRSGGKVSFPRGFITPKVGPHETYGFASGMIYGQPAALIVQEGFVNAGNPVVDYLLATDCKRDRVYIVLQNNRFQSTKFILKLNPEVFNKKIMRVELLSSNQSAVTNGAVLNLPGFGQEVLAVDMK